MQNHKMTAGWFLKSKYQFYVKNKPLKVHEKVKKTKLTFSRDEYNKTINQNNSRCQHLAIIKHKNKWQPTNCICTIIVSPRAFGLFLKINAFLYLKFHSTFEFSKCVLNFLKQKNECVRSLEVRSNWFVCGWEAWHDWLLTLAHRNEASTMRKHHAYI